MDHSTRTYVNGFVPGYLLILFNSFSFLLFKRSERYSCCNHCVILMFVTPSSCSDLESLRTCYEGVFEQSCGSRSAEVIGELIKKAFEDPRYLRFKYRADCSLHNSPPDVVVSPRVRHGSSTKRASLGTLVRNKIHMEESTSGDHRTVSFSGVKLLLLALVSWRLLCITWSTKTLSECDGWIYSHRRRCSADGEEGLKWMNSCTCMCTSVPRVDVRVSVQSAVTWVVVTPSIPFVVVSHRHPRNSIVLWNLPSKSQAIYTACQRSVLLNS